jgi:hypothetical protein
MGRVFHDLLCGMLGQYIAGKSRYRAIITMARL